MQADTLTSSETLDLLRGYRAAQAGAPFAPYETDAWRAGFSLHGERRAAA